MTEIETYQLKDVKLSLNVKTGKDAPKWTVAVNKMTVYGASVTKTYTSCLTVYHALKRALDVIACDSWRYASCAHCCELSPKVSKVKIWYDDDETGERTSYSQNVCVDCKLSLFKSGALKK